MEVNYIKLGITLFLALTISSLTVDGVRAYFAGQVLKQAAEAIKVESKKNEENRIRAAQQNRLQQIERDKQFKARNQRTYNDALRLKARRETNNEVCKYWSEEHSKIKSEYNQQMKLSACNRAKKD